MLRGQASNVITLEDCQKLISFQNSILFYDWNLDISKVTTRDTIRLSNSFRDAPSEVKDFVRVLRQKILDIVQKYIYEKIYVEFSNIAFRPPGTAHPMHADNRVYNKDTKEATIVKGHNPPTRHYSAILYLNSCEGGEFCFHNTDTIEEEVVIPVEPGKLLFFSSGVENLHSSRVTHSDRWTFVMFFTRDKNAEEII
jgi:hypothetical protein